jgi:hypothetical protein
VDSVSVGENKTTVVSFVSEQTLTNLAIWIVPELQPYVRPVPIGFSSVSAGTSYTITLTLSAPIDAPLATMEGTLHIRDAAKSGKTYSQPLPLSVTALSLEGTDVVGSVYASVPRLGQDGNAAQIFLPDITVSLRNAASAKQSTRVATDLSGRFVFTHQMSGTYELCLEAPGYISECRPEPVVVADTTVYLLPLAITPKPNVIAGRVRRADQSPCNYTDAFFGINVETTVVIADNRQPTRANNLGEYLLPQVPPGEYVVRAICQALQVEDAITLSGLAAVQLLDLVLPNALPVIKTIVATVNGKGVRRVTPGTTVTVTVEAADADGDPLQYRWRPSSESVGFQPQNAPTVVWTVPTVPALHTMYVLVSDGMGGYRLGKLDLSTDEEGALFSGRVSGKNTSAPQRSLLERVAGATVSINGVVTQTNEDGYFLLRVPQESPRYVLNITKDGYQPVSKVFNEEVLGGQYRLTSAQVFDIDPAQFIDVVEGSQGVKGARVVIQPNSLVDHDGNPPQTRLMLALSTIDQRDPEGLLLGDYGAVTASGLERTLTSFGAVHLEIKDAVGNSYNLLPGRTAFVSLPVDVGQPPFGHLDGRSPPPTSALWFYDPQAGRWHESGIAALVGDFYYATVEQLAVWTAAVAAPEAAPLRLLVNKTQVRLPFDVRVTIPTGIGLDKVYTKRLTDPISLIPHLPASTSITLEVLDSTRNPVPGSAQSWTSGTALEEEPSTPQYPYHNVIDALLIAPHLPPLPPGDGFLSAHYYTNDLDVANAYYAAIDPKNEKTTLDDWLRAFYDRCPSAPLETITVYYNAGDLGFGRRMRSTTSSECGTVYWVTNYPTVEDAAARRNQIATVAMEYSRAPDPTGRVFTKFFVFDAFGKRRTHADLDDRGEKYVPALCMVCHGGSIHMNVVSPESMRFIGGHVGGRFIPFDLDSFQYADLPPSAFTGHRRKDQEEAFKTQNTRLRTTNLSAGANELITGWYGGVDLPSPTFISTFVPFDWAANPSLYNNVVKPSCRSCHITQYYLDWTSLLMFKAWGGLIQTRVCGSRDMPNARVTWERFWASTDSHQPAVLAAADLERWDVTLPCPYR